MIVIFAPGYFKQNTGIVVFVFVRINSTVKFSKSMWAAKGLNSISYAPVDSLKFIL